MVMMMIPINHLVAHSKR